MMDGIPIVTWVVFQFIMWLTPGLLRMWFTRKKYPSTTVENHG
jgi:hypothetical protein